MAIETTCNGCGKRLSVSDEHAGKQARCPACGTIYTVVSPASRLTGSTDPRLAETIASDSTDVQRGSAHESQALEEFWMQASDGAQYGPVDRANLNRWFSEGRVGTGYQIRQGDSGVWQQAEFFRPVAGPAGQPAAAVNPYAPSMAPQLNRYPKTDQSGIILAMGILGIVFCVICSIVAVVMGGTALKDIEAGRVDPSNKTLVQVGYYMGIASIIMHLVCGGGWAVMVALSILRGGQF